jgi:hypothetical protein
MEHYVPVNWLHHHLIGKLVNYDKKIIKNIKHWHTLNVFFFLQLLVCYECIYLNHYPCLEKHKEKVKSVKQNVVFLFWL